MSARHALRLRLQTVAFEIIFEHVNSDIISFTIRFVALQIKFVMFFTGLNMTFHQKTLLFFNLLSYNREYIFRAYHNSMLLKPLNRTHKIRTKIWHIYMLVLSNIYEDANHKA